MTPNMLMVLLDVHRGTFSESRHMGTVHDDMKRLRLSGLVEMGMVQCLPKGNYIPCWRTTDLGRAVVNRACGALTEERNR